MSVPEIVRGPIRHSEGKGQPYQEVWYIKCPGCGLEAMADMDQMEGRVSIDCPDCDYHETHTIFGSTADG